MVEEQNKVEERDLIAEANAAAEKLRIEREKLEEVYKKYTETKSRDILGGKTTVTPQVEVSQEDKLQEELKNYWKGTSLERVFK